MVGFMGSFRTVYLVRCYPCSDERDNGRLRGPWSEAPQVAENP